MGQLLCAPEGRHCHCCCASRHTRQAYPRPPPPRTVASTPIQPWSRKPAVDPNLLFRQPKLPLRPPLCRVFRLAPPLAAGAAFAWASGRTVANPTGTMSELGPRAAEAAEGASPPLSIDPAHTNADGGPPTLELPPTAVELLSPEGVRVILLGTGERPPPPPSPPASTYARLSVYSRLSIHSRLFIHPRHPCRLSRDAAPAGADPSAADLCTSLTLRLPTVRGASPSAHQPCERRGSTALGGADPAGGCLCRAVSVAGVDAEPAPR